ncbi:UBN2 domain-containing protein [Tanacetum coccineum]
MHGSDITANMRHSRLMDKFDKFAAKEGESLDSVYESKYVTMVRQNQADKAISYDVLYDSLVQFEQHVLASRAKKATKNHDPLALIAYSNVFSSHPHANSSYSPQSYYVTHPLSIVDYDDEYQGDLQRDSQKDKLTTAMISGWTLKRMRDKIGIKCLMQEMEVMTAIKLFSVYHELILLQANMQCYNCNEKGHYARDCQKPKVRDAKYFREQMLLAMKDEVGSHLSNEENDFMLDNAYGEESLDKLTASVMLMARLQPADGTTDTVPSYDEKAVSQVHDSSKAHEQVSHVKHQTIIQTTDDDQIDSSIIFDDPYVDNNGGTSKHDSISHEECHEIQMLLYIIRNTS